MFGVKANPRASGVKVMSGCEGAAVAAADVPDSKGSPVIGVPEVDPLEDDAAPKPSADKIAGIPAEAMAGAAEDNKDGEDDEGAADEVCGT